MIEGFRQLFLGDEHTCPVWFAYTFDNPVRRLLHPPKRLFAGLVSEGQTALDIGCGMGHNALGLARLVGATGRVIAVDVQPGMLEVVRRRVERAGLAGRIELRQAQAGGMGLTERVDFALASWMVHEVRDKGALFREVRGLLKPEGRFLMTEPKVHVSAEAFEAEVGLALAAGLRVVGARRVALSRAVVFGGPADS